MMAFFIMTGVVTEISIPRKPDFQGETSDKYSCSVVNCHFDCGARLHHCKVRQG